MFSKFCSLLLYSPRGHARNGILRHSPLPPTHTLTTIAKQIIKSIKVHVFVMYKNMQVYWRGHQIWMFGRLSARTEKVSTSIKHGTKIHPKIYVKSMQNLCSKKWCQNHWKRCQAGSQWGAIMMKHVVSSKVHAESQQESIFGNGRGGWAS